MDDLSDDDEGVAFDEAPAGGHAAEEEEEEEMEITPDPSDPERRFWFVLYMTRPEGLPESCTRR